MKQKSWGLSVKFHVLLPLVPENDVNKKLNGKTKEKQRNQVSYKDDSLS